MLLLPRQQGEGGSYGELGGARRGGMYKFSVCVYACGVWTYNILGSEMCVCVFLRWWFNFIFVFFLNYKDEGWFANGGGSEPAQEHGGFLRDWQGQNRILTALQLRIAAQLHTYIHTSHVRFSVKKKANFSHQGEGNGEERVGKNERCFFNWQKNIIINVNLKALLIRRSDWA